MKKMFFMALALMCLSFAANAQNLKYQGEVSLGVSGGVGNFGINRIPIHTVHGVRLNPNFFVGAGIGVDIFTDNGESGTVIPIFANAKGYYPLSHKVSLLAALDLGYGVGAGNFSGIGGFYVYPQIGCSLNVSSRHALDFTVGYNSQSFSEKGVSISSGAIGFKVAFVW